jgi:hypothetical protein
MRDRVLAFIESRLEADPRPLTDQLRAFYAPRSDECGTNFLDGTEFEAPYGITAADLFAVTMLGVPISPPAARRRSRVRADRSLPFTDPDAAGRDPCRGRIPSRSGDG